MAVWKRKIIYQCQITDYIGELIIIFFDMGNPTHRKYYRQLLRGAGIKKRKTRVLLRIPPKGQRILDQFFPSSALTGLLSFKLPYHQQVRLPQYPLLLLNRWNTRHCKPFRGQKAIWITSFNSIPLPTGMISRVLRSRMLYTALLRRQMSLKSKWPAINGASQNMVAGLNY